MKQIEDDFYALYNEYESILETGSEDVDSITTYQNVIRKAGLNPLRPFRKRPSKILLIAAILATAALAAGAAIYSVSDAFHGVLDVHNRAADISSAGSILNRTGQLLDQTAKSNIVDFTLRAAVGDDRTLKVLVDVVDHSGKGLAISQADKSKSAGSFGLRDYTLTKANGDVLSGGSTYSFINIDPTNGKFTILFDYAVSGDTLRDQTLHLHFQDILQSAKLDGTALDMEPDTLHTLVSGFGPYTDSDFLMDDSTGQKARLLHVADSKAGSPLSKDQPGFKVIAATVRDGSLYLQGTADSSALLDKILDNAVLSNGAGDSISASETSWDDDNSWAIRFDGFDSVDSLKGYVWRYGAGEAFHTAYEGSWDFSFKVNMEDVKVKLTPNCSAVWEDHSVTITNLEISPYSLFLQYSVDEDTFLQMFPPFEWGTVQTSAWIESEHPITLNMKDGSVIQVLGGSLAPKGGNLAMAPSGTVVTEYEMLYRIDTVIDPAQILSIKIGKQMIPLNKQ